MAFFADNSVRKIIFAVGFAKAYGNPCSVTHGEMLEWLKRHAWKACKRRNRFGGSNPPLSAINIENQCFTKQTPDFTPKNVKSGVCLLRIWHYYFIPFFLMVETPFMVITL